MAPQQIAHRAPISVTGLRVLKVLNILFFLFMLAFNYLANAMPLNRKTTGELSDQYPNLFTPIGLTFSIWGVIYSAVLCFVIWQCWPMRNAARSARRDLALRALSWDFVGLCLLNVLWLFCWHYEFIRASVVVMLLTLTLLIRMNRIIFRQLPHTTDHRNFLQIPFGLYLGWISVATVANITAFLVGIQWSALGLSEKTWTLLMIGIATLLALAAVWRWNNIPYALAVSWALLGIALKHNEIFQTSFSIIIFTAAACMVLLLIAAGRRFSTWWNSAVPGDSYRVAEVNYDI